ncbi:MAG: hypothetical protein OEY20_06940 [Gemmatimonadota bacterium]|nr:hypothetical protein [Gemmatimonadota bacterium]MDH4350063.1 hypothetical protein [Gemmatimonadota bacterium]MDH5196971.1 hypothetical protein [Gemmatimonadota bacterium]
MSEPVNIGPRGIRRRRALGLVGLGGGVLVAAVLTVRESPLAWLAATAPLFWLGNLGILQARAKT